MNKKYKLRGVTVVLLALLMVIFISSGSFFTHAAGGFTDHWLSSDGGVKASYDDLTGKLVIRGIGVVEYDRWVTMAQKINPKYFGADNSWSAVISEDDMSIDFYGNLNAIKLCGTGPGKQGLFRNFSGDIFFHDAVDLSPNARRLSYMFANAPKFNQPVNWQTANVEAMDFMFYRATSFNHRVVFDTAKVKSMESMFNAAATFNQPLELNTSKVTNMQCMFFDAKAFDSLVKFDTSNVTDFSSMFAGATVFNKPVIFNISSADDLSNMLYETPVEYVVLDNTTLNLNANASAAFSKCLNLKYLKFSGLKNAAIDGFSGDYFVAENGAQPIAKMATEPYQFVDNLGYRVYLQSSVPNLTLSGEGDAIKANWTAVFGSAGYELHRADQINGPYGLIAETGNLEHVDSSGLISGMPYFYKVRPFYYVNGYKIFGEFSEVKGYYAPGVLAKPDKPILKLDRNGNGIRLNWNMQKRIIGYQIFRGPSPDKAFSYLKTLPGTALNYTDLEGLNQGRPYYYKIRAYRMAKGIRAYSPFSNIEGMFAGTDEYALDAVNFTLDDNPDVTEPNVRVSWLKVAGADGYCIYRWDSPNQCWIGLKKTGPDARVYTNVNGVVNHKTNFYGMRPYHISGGITYYGNIGQAKGFRVDK